MMRLSLRHAPLLTAVVLGLLAFGATELSAQSKKGRPATGSSAGRETVVLEVGREKFTAQQIADAFTKNTSRGKSFFQLQRDSALDFVNIYANYRLKVQAAEDAGLAKRPEIIEELRNNRMQLAVPVPPASGYLIERKVVDPAVEQIFKRRGEELKVAVLFTSMKANDPADTLRAFQRTMDMFNKLKAGADFAKMAADSSNDPGTKAGGGSIGFITSGMVLRSLEDAAYETAAGKVYDGIIRVPSGFVLLKVLDRMPRYRARAAHILFEADTKDMANEKTQKQLAKARETLQKIRSGGDFAALARELSEDHTSGEQGGDLVSYYTRSLGFESRNGKLVPEFEDAMYKLEPGQVSDIVTTDYGFHIVKLIDKQKPKFEDEKELIRQLYKQRYLAEDRVTYVNKLLSEQGYWLNDAVVHQILGVVNQRATAADSMWAAPINVELRAKTLYNYRKNPVTVGAWIDSVETHQQLRAIPLSYEGIRSSTIALLEPVVLAEAAKNLESEYPEFASLMREFRDGILIFKLEEEMVWSKVNQGYDEAQGEVFFNRHRERYNTQPKLALTEIFLYKEDEVKPMLEKARSGIVPFDTLAAQNTQRQGYRERAGKWPMNSARNTDLVKQVLDRKPNAKAGDIIEPFAYQGGWSIVRVDQVEPVRPMTYEEARSEVQGDFMDERQKQLTKEWLDTLRVKYRVKINERALESLLAAK
jgi:peptidyl-prolyl cis-trans isomerase SurA